MPGMGRRGNYKGRRSYGPIARVNRARAFSRLFKNHRIMKGSMRTQYKKLYKPRRSRYAAVIGRGRYRTRLPPIHRR